MTGEIAEHLLPMRRLRAFPRVVKRKMSSFAGCCGNRAEVVLAGLVGWVAGARRRGQGRLSPPSGRG
jgi:hypothetical protein